MNNELGITRREFVAYGISTGFALATMPISAWALTTPSDGLVTGSVQIPTEGGGQMPGYFARPQGDGPFPTILLIHEVFGVHAYIQDVCRRLAKQGYFAVCPYLYFRHGDVTKLSDFEQIKPIVAASDQAHVWSDLDSVIAWLQKSNLSANRAKLGIMGFCWGGGVTWTYSAHNPAIRAGVAWYGPLAGTPTPAQPKFPVDLVADLKTPILGLYGGKDDHITADQIAKMRAALKNSPSSHSEIVVYPDAQHGFHADYRPSYNEKDAKDGWNRALAWFKANGVA